MVDVFAPAKINLTLHVTGQNSAGYHLLDSLVAFASVGDTVSVRNADTFGITVSGPEAAGVPLDMRNLALRAASLISDDGGAMVHLLKRLPLASGIGGGSADAAAAVRAMLTLERNGKVAARSLWAMPDAVQETYAKALLELGADVPMCLLSRPVRARGVGEKLSFVELPPVPAVLVNPRVPVSTPDVFAQLTTKGNAPMPEILPEFDTAEALISFLREMRNDLAEPAIRCAPAIADVLYALDAVPGCLLTRMSGSGATCFALFGVQTDAGAAASLLRRKHPDWWVADCWLGNQMAAGLP